jgi:hypothetical protein
MINVVSGIKYWFRYDAKYLHKEIYQGIRNLIYWFPIIWRDRDWDYRYIYDVLGAKIEKQAKYTAKYGNHLSAKRDAEVMMTCTRLMKKVVQEYYSSEVGDYHKTEWEFIPIEGSNSSTLKFNEMSNNFEDYFAKYPSACKKVMALEGTTEGERDKKSIAFKISTYNQSKAHKLLFKILENNMERWWD